MESQRAAEMILGSSATSSVIIVLLQLQMEAQRAVELILRSSATSSVNIVLLQRQMEAQRAAEMILGSSATSSVNSLNSLNSLPDQVSLKQLLPISFSQNPWIIKEGKNRFLKNSAIMF